MTKFKLPRKKKKLLSKWLSKGEWSFTLSPAATNVTENDVYRDVWTMLRNAKYNQGVTEMFKEENKEKK